MSNAGTTLYNRAFDVPLKLDPSEIIRIIIIFVSGNNVHVSGSWDITQIKGSKV